jgi:MFS transporter, FHS family, glucose/mannose:H+ symporter
LQRTLMIVAIVLVYMLFGILLNSVGTVILQSIATLGQTKGSAAILEAFKDLPIAFTSFLVASLLPRVGLRRSMMIGTAMVGIACLAMPLAPSFATAKLLFAATGIAFALVKVSVYAMIGLLTETPAAHASMTSTIEGLFMIGVLSGYWIFGAFIDADDPLAWLDVYWLLAALSGIAFAALALARLDETAARSEHGDPLRDFLAMLALCAKPLVLIFALSAFLYVLIEQAIGTWLPTFNNEVLHLPAAMSIQAASIFAAAVAVGRLGAGVILRRIAWFPLIATCIVGMAALVLVALPMTRGITVNPAVTWLSAPAAAYILPIIGLLLAPIYPTLNSVMLSAMPRGDHASLTGLLVVFSALGGTTGSFVTGQVFARFDGQTAFYLVLVPMALLLGALYRFQVASAQREGT